MRISTIVLTTLIAGLVLPGCGREQQAAAPAPAPALPAGVLVDQPLEPATPIAQVVANARDGEEVTAIGRIGGRKDPFVADRAVMLIIDKSLINCTDEGDNCPTPWDYCCEAPDQILANSATVQIVDEQGRPLRMGLNGVEGLRPLSEVVVRGKVHRPGDGKVVTINAEQLHILSSR